MNIIINSRGHSCSGWCTSSLAIKSQTVWTCWKLIQKFIFSYLHLTWLDNTWSYVEKRHFYDLILILHPINFLLLHKLFYCFRAFDLASMHQWHISCRKRLNQLLYQSRKMERLGHLPKLVSNLNCSISISWEKRVSNVFYLSPIQAICQELICL